MAKRSIYGINWIDELAWTESMNSDKWYSFLQGEKEHFSKAVGTNIKVLEKEIRNEYNKFDSLPYKLDGAVIIRNAFNGYKWFWESNPSIVFHAVYITSCSSGYIWYIEDTSNGSENYTLFCMKEGSSTPVWKKKNVYPHVCIINNRCYFLQAKHVQVYSKLISCNAITGEDSKTLYSELILHYNLELISCNTSVCYMKRVSGSYEDVFEINSKGDIAQIEDHSVKSRRFILDTQPDQYIKWTKVTGWKCSKPLSKWILPSFTRYIPEYIDTTAGIYVTKWLGVRSIWKISMNEPVLLWNDVGQVEFAGPYICIIQPGMIPIWKNIQTFNTPIVPPLFQKNIYIVPSKKDKKPVPFILIRPKRGYGKGLLVTGYGAYGDPTSMNLGKWECLLQRGWSICIGCWRGGGDHTPEWEDAGKRAGRLDVLDDAYSVIKRAQELTHIGPSKTVLYGRSAGGLWVGGLSAEYPDGSLAKGAYMEVPYLDVLRTTMNRTLPLTEVEMNEFGLPTERIADFASIISWSPMEQLQEHGIPGMFQILRTSEHDTQVYAYESVKWVIRARGSTNRNVRPIYMAFNKDQGHFLDFDEKIHSTAQDISLILSLVK